ncbi:MAG: hypothetical protein V4736_07645 [Bdellovibrionota bacterium]
MICGLLTQVAMTAVLLGNQNLTVDHQKDSGKKYCLGTEPSNANAVIILKDEKGNPVLERKIRISEFSHYNNEKDRGSIPANETSVIFSYPRTAQTKKAKSIELNVIEAKFTQSTTLASKKVDTK